MKSTQAEHDMIVRLLVREGWDVTTNNPKDSGGMTRWGITQKTLDAYVKANPEFVAKHFRFESHSVRYLPIEGAIEIYLDNYYDKPNIDLLAPTHPTLAEQVFDFGVLAGQKTSIIILQRVLNVLNKEGKLWRDLKLDGAIGTETLTALKLSTVNKYKTLVQQMVAARQSVYLMDLAEKREKDETFMAGWQAKRAIGVLTEIQNIGRSS